MGRGEERVAWKTPIPGKGWSLPVVVADGNVWVTTVVPGTGGVSPRVVGVDRKSGELKHEVELFARQVAAAPRPGHTASPTPAVVGDTVIASFGSDGVGCVDATAGKVLWRNDTLKVNYETGSGR